jgi:hypothetical protein
MVMKFGSKKGAKARKSNSFFIFINSDIIKELISLKKGRNGTVRGKMGQKDTNRFL